MKTGAELIIEERARQIAEEGYDIEHDDQHVNGELISAAVAYGMPRCNWPLPVEANTRLALAWWPWNEEDWKPSEDVIRDLVKMGALVAAELDRRLRMKQLHDAEAARREPPAVIAEPPAPALENKRVVLKVYGKPEGDK